MVKSFAPEAFILSLRKIHAVLPSVLSCLFLFFWTGQDLFAQTTPRQSSPRQRLQNLRENQRENLRENQRTGLFRARTEAAKESKEFDEGNAVQEQAALTEKNRKETLRNIPWNQLTQAEQTRVKSVINDQTLYRRLPEQSAYCREDVYRFLVEHPDVVVAFWKKMGVTQISLDELRPGKYQLKEHPGTVATVEVLHSSPGLVLLHAQGFYRGPLLSRKIDGEGVFVLRQRFAKDRDGDSFVVCRLDVFLKIRNPGADLIAKLFSGMVGKIADANFEQTVAFVGSVSDAIVEDPRGMIGMLDKLPSIRREVITDFQGLIVRSVEERFRGGMYAGHASGFPASGHGVLAYGTPAYEAPAYGKPGPGAFGASDTSAAPPSSSAYVPSSDSGSSFRSPQTASRKQTAAAFDKSFDPSWITTTLASEFDVSPWEDTVKDTDGDTEVSGAVPDEGKNQTDDVVETTVKTEDADNDLGEMSGIEREIVKTDAKNAVEEMPALTEFALQARSKNILKPSFEDEDLDAICDALFGTPNATKSDVALDANPRAQDSGETVSATPASPQGTGRVIFKTPTLPKNGVPKVQLAEE